MIVYSMSPEEIRQHLEDKWKEKKAWVVSCRKNFRRLVLKSFKFPIDKLYERSNKDGMSFFVHCFALSKRNADNPIVTLYCIFDLSEGKYAASVSYEGIMHLYPPHFFRRYRERIVKSDEFSTLELIKHFFAHNEGGCMITQINVEYESIPMKYDEFIHGEHINVAGVNDYGYIFGEINGKMQIMKTIISKDMIYDNQRDLFRNLDQQYAEYLKRQNTLLERGLCV